jgi:hypothetical protein
MKDREQKGYGRVNGLLGLDVRKVPKVRWW